MHYLLYSPGKVFVHCVMGVSRSGALVLAYLMIHQGLLLVDAIIAVRLNRDIGPNSGFLEQLRELELSLSLQSREEAHTFSQWTLTPTTNSVNFCKISSI